VRRPATRINLAGFLILLYLAVTGFNTWQRFDWGRIAVVVRNLTSDTQVVRVIDGTSGRYTGTFAVDGAHASLLVDERLDTWFRDLSPTEEARGLSNDFIVELLGPDGCELIDRQRVDHRDPSIDVDAGGFLSFLDGAAPIPTIADRLPDPCAGRPAAPRGLIANLTRLPVVVGPGVLIGPCSTRTLLPGDLVKVGTPVVPRDAVRVRIPSIQAQDEHWPLEPRVVRLTSADVFDEPAGRIEPYEFASCDGSVPRKFVIPD
jgi:hypothetical protein